MATLLLQHSDVGRPGRLGVTLRDHGHLLDIRRPDKGDPIPTDFDDVDAVVSLGGAASVADDQRPEWMSQEIAFLAEAHERQLPVVGVCLGHQMLAAALGGEVGVMEQPEVGFYDMHISAAGQTDSVLAGVAWTSKQFMHHSDHVTQAPAGAAVLASTDRCPVVAFRAGVRTYGFQHHPEVDRDLLLDIVHANPDAMHKAGKTEKEIMDEAEAHYEQFARLSDRLCLNLATLILAPTRRVAV